MRDLEALGKVAAGQHGLVARTDLSALGVGPKARERLLRAQLLVPAGTRAYRLVGAPITDRQRVLAACLGVGGWASHSTAAALHGLEGFRLLDQLEVTVQKGRRTTRPSEPTTTVHCTRWLPTRDVLVVEAVPVVSVARTLFDLAGQADQLGLRRIENTVDAAVRDGKASDGWLWSVLESTRRRGRRGVKVFEEILMRRADGEITESWLERETIRILKSAGLPLPVCQARIAPDGAFVARVDFLYEDLRIVIEVNGYRHHRTQAQTTADAKRRRRLTRAGYEVHEFTYEEIVDRPGELVALVREIHGDL